jgi:glycosyltransferase involved in cell wall biosynthesis
MTHLVSIIIPTYNRWNFLPEAIKSVFNQTYTNWEMIVVNDGGQPPEGKILDYLKDPRVRYIEHPRNMGIASARNTALSNSSGNFIAYLDDDDIFYPNHLEILTTGMTRNNWEIAYTDSYKGNYSLSGKNYKLIKKEVQYSLDYDVNKLWKANFIPTLCICHRRDCLSRTGNFDVSFEVLEDWHMWLKMSRYFIFHHIPQITAEYRVRLDNTNTTQRTSDEVWKQASLKIYRYFLNDPQITQDTAYLKYLKNGITKFISKNDKWVLQGLRGDPLALSLKELLSIVPLHGWIRIFLLHPISFIRLRMMRSNVL